VNDTFGHAEGDELLRQVASRLKARAHGKDQLCRLGGDEFALIVPEVDDVNEVVQLANKLIGDLSEPYDLDGHQAVLGASIGVAIAPDHGSDPDQLLKHADLAMYAAKAAGRGTFRFFEPEMDARLQARQSLEHDLRAAVEADGLELHFQPIVHVESGTVRGFEALLRWRHPVRGVVSPAEFIPIAEDTGLIQRIGRWALRQACHEAVNWPSQIRVAVNLSPVQFRDPNLVEEIFSALAESRLDPTRLELEITESVLLNDSRTVLETLHNIRGFGVKIAMDDFGTGYSSLSYLRRFPFDKIKIDQTFIRALTREQDAAPIVRAIVALATSLGMATTAEGVETREQFELVRAEGCNEAQGYLFSPAVAPVSIPLLLKQLHAAEKLSAA
jgi:diguanylate cyclase (GGDEF)-like protein